MSEKQIEISGIAIQYDKSGAGYAWVPATDDNCHAGIREEIAAEIEDGMESCDDYVASNGQHYRW